MLKKQIVIAIAATLLGTLAVAGQAANEPEHTGHEHAEHHAAHHPHWAYDGSNGPDHWSDLDAQYATCHTGKNQSPINLTHFTDAELPPIQFNYQAGGDEIVNNGHTIQVNYAAGSTITLSGQTFELKQFHAHAPSENQINGKSFPMEAHFVHADDHGNLAVIAVMFEEGAVNAELEKAWKAMPEEEGKSVKLGENLLGTAVMPESTAYYRFSGSLTTPPCSEGVIWLVMKQPVSASKEQIEKFAHTLHHHNNRPVQPTNARLILE